MSTKRETILAAAKSALTGVSGISNANVFRSRAAAVAKREFPALVIEPVTDQADNPNIHRLQWNLTFQVAVLYRTESPDQAADATIGDVHNKIMTSSTLLGLVSNLVPSQVSWQFIDADLTIGIVLIQFVASYQTDLNTL